MTTDGKFFRAGGEKWLLKGVAYGPFEGADGYPPPDQARRDLEQIRTLGFNVLRVYMPPPPWFGAACAEAGLRLLAGWPWLSHTDFLRSRKGAAEIIRAARGVARALRDVPGVLGVVVGNEIPAVLARWMGRDRVQAFLERLVEACREECPGALAAYATFPSTEYLSPRNADFFLCNVYLEQEEAFARYLARLQHLAGDKPLVIGECGLDTRAHGGPAQAELLAWAWRAALHAGAAGQVVFSFTDEWHNNGRAMSEWAFGLATPERVEKEACAALRGMLPALATPGQGVRLRRTPRISIVICTYNGSRTLRQALDSLQDLVYPDYEVLLIDDGSTDAVPEIALEYRDVRSFRIGHGGLSKARNFGAWQAGGEIIAFLDDDAFADREWLLYLALAFEGERVGAAGGPNIPPPARGLAEACIAEAPGSPAPVLINDVDAEHLPGCNLAVLKSAWEEVGGFDERYWVAGDDVDFCWRLLEHGYKIAFHPGVMVWHERRRTIRAYFRQQAGYGKAEALLTGHHQHRFNKLGSARWRGVIYEPSARARSAGAFVYQGIYGAAPYQFLYTGHPAGALEAMTGVWWLVLTAGVALGAFWQPWLLGVALAMLAVPCWVALRTSLRLPPPAWRKRPDEENGLKEGRRSSSSAVDALLSRACLFLLVLGQPVVRSAARWIGRFRLRAWPRGPWLARPVFRWPERPARKTVSETAFWSEGRGEEERHRLLALALEELRRAGWPVAEGGAWADWDFEVKRSRWWPVRVVTATEYHAPGGQLTRVKLLTRAAWPTLAVAALTTSAVAILLAWHVAWGFWALAASFLIWLALEYHHGVAAGRVMRLIATCARHLDLHRLEENAPQKTEAPSSPEPPMNGVI